MEAGGWFAGLKPGGYIASMGTLSQQHSQKWLCHRSFAGDACLKLTPGSGVKPAPTWDWRGKPRSHKDHRLEVAS